MIAAMSIRGMLIYFSYFPKPKGFLMKNHLLNVVIKAEIIKKTKPATIQVAEFGKATKLTLGQGNDTYEGCGRRFV
jgi:hypothetical protein